MKKVFALLFFVMAAVTLVACGKKEELKVTFVPSRDAADILSTVKPLEELLLTKLKEKGVNKYSAVKINVSSSYEAAGEALSAGTTDIAFLPGGTYVVYAEDKTIDVALASTRAGLSKDSANAKDWNDGKATLPTSEQVAFYRSLIVAGPTAKGQELASKVNNGQALTWDDIKDAKWGVQGATSSAGTIYPSGWLYNNFNNKTVNDLTSQTNAGGYGAAAAGLAAGTYDIITMYADARRDYEKNWTSNGEGGYGRSKSIWEETNVIGVTDGIFNDTISISKSTIDEAMKKIIQDVFIELAKTEAGKAIFAIYSHDGYIQVKDSDYDGARTAQKVITGK